MPSARTALPLRLPAEMRSAVLYDIHGNRAALDAVLADAEAEEFDRLVVGGDLALFGPDAAGCVDRLRAYGDQLIAIKGNTDRYVVERRGEAAWWADRLGEQRLAWLDALPTQVRLAEHDALVVHATPRGDEDLLMPDTEDDAVRAMLAGVGERLVLCGHVHVQYRRACGTHEIVNPGSVGLPFDGDQRAAWAMLEEGAVSLRRTRYDVEVAIAAVEACGAPVTDVVTRRLRRAAPD
jgi:putative phosphoesterase